MPSKKPVCWICKGESGNSEVPEVQRAGEKPAHFDCWEELQVLMAEAKKEFGGTK